MTPLEVLDWMLGRGLAAIIQAYGASVADGRIACRNGPSGDRPLDEKPAPAAGSTCRPCRALEFAEARGVGVNGTLLLSAAGADATRPLDEQGDAFWWSAQSDATLAAALTRGAAAGWNAGARLVRGAGPSADDLSLTAGCSR